MFVFFSIVFMSIIICTSYGNPVYIIDNVTASDDSISQSQIVCNENGLSTDNNTLFEVKVSYST